MHKGRRLTDITAATLVLGLLAVSWALGLGVSQAVSDSTYSWRQAGTPAHAARVQRVAASGAVGTVVDWEATPIPTTPPGGANPDWTLAVEGLVQSPLNLSLEDLVAMPTTMVYAQLICVGWPVAPLVEGNWTGVRLGLLLEEAGVSPEAVKVAFYADDGYTTDLTVATAMRGDIIVAYERDDQPLWEKLRLVVPGKWGYKWIRNLTRIVLVDYDFKGTYESRGYSDEADIPGFVPTPTPSPTPPPAVGGVVEVRQDTPPLSAPQSNAGASLGIALAGGLTATALALAGAWHARRRWGR